MFCATLTAQLACHHGPDATDLAEDRAQDRVHGASGRLAHVPLTLVIVTATSRRIVDRT
ncbi:MAG: hypothetical protein R3C10_09735 [Pirellulales bacterium]